MLKQHTMFLRNGKDTTHYNSIYDFEDETELELDELNPCCYLEDIFERDYKKYSQYINLLHCRRYIIGSIEDIISNKDLKWRYRKYCYIVFDKENDDVLEIKRNDKFVDILNYKEAKELFLKAIDLNF